MKLVGKWVLDRQTEIPETKACTSVPCVWSVPQSRDRTEKPHDVIFFSNGFQICKFGGPYQGLSVNALNCLGQVLQKNYKNTMMT